MSRSSLNNDIILRRLRASQEYDHRRYQEYFFEFGLLALPPSSSIPQVYLEHIQDSCNKSTAIYSITPRPEPHTDAYCRDVALRIEIIFLIYEQWFRDHNVDIDFGNFVTKFIRIETSNDEQHQTIENIIKIHTAWCEHVEISLPLCSRKKDSTGAEIDDPSFEFHGCMGINRRQAMFYKLQPLFRALILVVDHRASSGAEKLVHLVRTNTPSKLSAPIDFDSISPKLHSDMFSGHDKDNVVTTTLPVAIDFVTREERFSREST
ncbi:MAG: hypothetical protein Q9212_004554 [Teloschistes hypoglaucus]